MQRKQLRHDYKEAKIKETRNLSDLNELEDENVMLQKQNQMLRQSQVTKCLDTYYPLSANAPSVIMQCFVMDTSLCSPREILQHLHDILYHDIFT